MKLCRPVIGIVPLVVILLASIVSSAVFCRDMAVLCAAGHDLPSHW